MNVADMTIEDAVLLAEKYAQLQVRHDELDAMFTESMGRKPDDVKAILRQFMDFNGVDELVDAETGKGVKLGKPRRSTQWDTLSLPEATLLALKDMNLVDIRTTAFDAMDKAGGALALDEAKKYRIDGETAAPFQTVKG